MRDDLTILIQGPINEISLNVIPDYSKFAKNIIISTWNLTESEINSLYAKYGSVCNLKVISEIQPNYMDLINSNQIVGVTPGTTWYLQVLGLYNGVKNCDTKYIIRTRSDEFFKNLEPLLLKVNENNFKFTCSNIWFKPRHFMQLHIGDHLYFSKTNILKKSINFILDTIHKKNSNIVRAVDMVYQIGSPQCGINYPESILAKSVIMFTKNIENVDAEYQNIDWASIDLCKEVFDIIDINELKPMRWSWVRGGSNGENFDKSYVTDPSMDFISNINEYK